MKLKAKKKKKTKIAKFYIFRGIVIPGINVWLFENFQNLIALQVCCFGFIKIFEWFTSGTALGQNNLNVSEETICKN